MFSFYSKKFVISLLEHLDQATPTASTSNEGVITCKVSPSRLLQPIFSVSWYIPKLNRTYGVEYTKLMTRTRANVAPSNQNSISRA